MLFIENSKKFISCKVARCEILQIKKLNMSKSFKSFAQMFFKMLSNNLNTHDQIKHSINFVKKNTSRINCVYNISQDKFIAFRNYIVNVLKKIKFVLSANRSKHLFYL